MSGLDLPTITNGGLLLWIICVGFASWLLMDLSQR